MVLRAAQVDVGYEAQVLPKFSREPTAGRSRAVTELADVRRLVGEYFGFVRGCAGTGANKASRAGDWMLTYAGTGRYCCETCSRRCGRASR